MMSWSAASAASVDASIEARLQALEATLGVIPLKEGDSSLDIETRLDALQTKIKASTPSSLHSTWDESDRLLRDLDPGPTLTYQQTFKNYPILYRRKEVLASADSIKADMGQLSTLLNLLLISQKNIDSPLRQEQVTQAPILTSVVISEEQERRLDSMLLKLGELSRSIQDMADRVDFLVDSYHAVMTTMSEKMVAADEKSNHLKELECATK
jgi:hypothetical protein